MSNVYHQIKDALVWALKTALPDMDVTSEHLAKTDYGGSSDITNYIYISLTPVSPGDRERVPYAAQRRHRPGRAYGPRGQCRILGARRHHRPFHPPGHPLG